MNTQDSARSIAHEAEQIRKLAREILEGSLLDSTRKLQDVAIRALNIRIKADRIVDLEPSEAPKRAFFKGGGRDV